MLAKGPGTFKYRLRSGDIDYASISASEKSWVKAWVVRNGQSTLVEDQFVGEYSPHTWWSNNALLGRECSMGQDFEIVIELGPGTQFRLEGDIEQL